MENSNSIEHINNPKLLENKTLISTTPFKGEECHVQYGGITNTEELFLDSKSAKSKCSKLCHFLTTLTIEPATFFFLFSFMMVMSCHSNLIMDKGCLNYFNYTKEVCDNLSAHAVEKENVEILANDYGLYCNLMSLIAAVAMIFITPWSDKYGRKVPLILTCIGSILSDLGIVMSIIYFESSLNYLILIRLPSEVVGGFICFLTIIYSHAAEVSTEKMRTLKYLTVEASFVVAMSVGGFAGGMILEYYGYLYVYVTAMIMHFLTAVWVIFVVEETVGNGMNTTWVEKGKNFFRSDSISRSWKTVVKPRENNKRLAIWMYFLSMCTIILTYEVFGGLGYMYSHHIYNWIPAMYNTVNMTFSLFAFGVTAVCVPIFFKVLKLSDSVLGMTGTFSMMGKNFLIAFAKYDVLIYYIGNAAGILSGFAQLSIRAGLSKLTNKEETGMVFAFLATCEAIFPMLGTAFSTKLFNATIDSSPSVIYLLSVAFLLIPLGTFIWIFIKTRKESSLTPFQAI